MPVVRLRITIRFTIRGRLAFTETRYLQLVCQSAPPGLDLAYTFQQELSSHPDWPQEEFIDTQAEFPNRNTRLVRRRDSSAARTDSEGWPLGATLVPAGDQRTSDEEDDEGTFEPPRAAQQ